MGKQKDQHNELEQLSRGKLRMVLSDWVVNSLDAEDYAFDFEVRPIGWLEEPREVDSAPFFVQLKGSRRFDNESSVWKDLDTSFLIDDCLTASIPVVLIVYERAADECYWCVLQQYCWDVLDADHDDWRSQDSVRIHVDRKPLAIHAPNHALRGAVTDTQRRITLRSHVATARRPTFDYPSWIHIASSAEVAEHKAEIIEEVQALADAGCRDLARKRAMRVFQMPEEDVSTLEAADLLIDLGELTDPADAFARERIARGGYRLATRYGRTELADAFEAVIETSWEYLEEHFIGATYFAESAEQPVLVLDIPQTVDHGNDSVTPIALMQYAAGELGETDARTIASGEEYRMIEDGSGTRPLEAACAERDHDFSTEDLREHAPFAICRECGLSCDVIHDLLGHNVPSVCAECQGIVYETEVRRVETADRVHEEEVCLDCAL